MKIRNLTYESVGVSYGSIDPWKVQCQAAAASTRHNLRRHNFNEVEWSRGESAFVVEGPDCYFGHVQEGLGTKNLVADQMYTLTGRSYYDAIAQDLVAMIVNDLCTLGIAPVSVALHVAAGDSNWFTDRIRCADFIRGFQSACDRAGAVWGPGESPSLPQIVASGTVELSGSAFGIAQPKNRLIVPAVEDGDAIVLVESSGIHSNGLTLARRIETDLRDGYLSKLSDGASYGESLLTPTHIYCELVDSLLQKNVPLHYMIHITGHGWRKLMRHSRPFEYVIEHIPEPQPIFRFIQEHAALSDREMYGNFNMGAGFAFIVPVKHARDVTEVASDRNLRAWTAGRVHEANASSVRINPLGITYSAETMTLR